MTLASPLAAGVSVINNTACVREGPTTVAACASVATATTGAAALKVVEITHPGHRCARRRADLGHGGAKHRQPGSRRRRPGGDRHPCLRRRRLARLELRPRRRPRRRQLHRRAGHPRRRRRSMAPSRSPSRRRFPPASPPSPTPPAPAPPDGAGLRQRSPRPPGNPHLSLAKSYAGPALAASATLVFQLAYANTGDQDAAAASLGETVPDATAFAAAASSPGWTCSPAAGGQRHLHPGPGAAAGRRLRHPHLRLDRRRAAAAEAAADRQQRLPDRRRRRHRLLQRPDPAPATGNPGGGHTSPPPSRPWAAPTPATLFTLLGSVAVGRLRRRNKPGGGPPAAPLAPPTGGGQPR